MCWPERTICQHCPCSDALLSGLGHGVLASQWLHINLANFACTRLSTEFCACIAATVRWSLSMNGFLSFVSAGIESRLGAVYEPEIPQTLRPKCCAIRVFLKYQLKTVSIRVRLLWSSHVQILSDSMTYVHFAYDICPVRLFRFLSIYNLQDLSPTQWCHEFNELRGTNQKKSECTKKIFRRYLSANWYAIIWSFWPEIILQEIYEHSKIYYITVYRKIQTCMERE